MKVKFCVNCIWSAPEEGSAWNLRCTNPKVNANDSYALSASEIRGSSCREERSKGIFAACGKSGKQYEELKYAVS